MELDNVILSAAKKGKVQKLKNEIEYLRVKDSFGKFERGTVIVRDRIIWGFPHIKRIFTLKNGLKNMGECELYAEEKIDGFNVRITSIEGEVYAFTRGGFLDRFVTEKIREMKLKIFNDYPNYVLCGEMIGNTPYTPPTKNYDVKLFVFDIDLGNGEYMPCEERYKILKKYGIEPAPVIGKFFSNNYDDLRKIILSLNKDRKEGMVLKSIDRTKAIKYVTPFSDIEDIAKESAIFYDMPIGFYYQRVLRSAFFISDFGLDKEEYAKRLGMAFYDGLMNSIKRAKEGQDSDQEHEISIKNIDIWNDILAHMSKEVKIEQLWKKEEGGKTKIRFRKIYKKTTKNLHAYAGGKAIED